MIYNRFFDHVLSEIEAGNARDGITALVGMLDTVALQPHMLGQARAGLLQHYLFQALCEFPALRAVNQSSFVARQVVEALLDRSQAQQASGMGGRLADVIADISLTRALKQRRDLMAERIATAWTQGQRICLIDCGALTEMPGLIGKNLANVTMVSRDADTLNRARQTLGSSFTALMLDRPENLSRLSIAPEGYDLICGTYLTDDADQRTCATILTRLSKSLAPNGTILLATLLPDHFGSGWRAACLNWTPNLFDENALSEIAAATGLGANLYRDPFNTILWAELTRAVSRKSTGGRS